MGAGGSSSSTPSHPSFIAAAAVAASASLRLRSISLAGTAASMAWCGPGMVLEEMRMGPVGARPRARYQPPRRASAMCAQHENGDRKTWWHLRPSSEPPALVVVFVLRPKI